MCVRTSPAPLCRFVDLLFNRRLRLSPSSMGITSSSSPAPQICCRPHSTTHLGGCPSRGGVRCRDRPLLLIGERGHLSQASALLSPLSCLARGGCRYPRSRSFTLPVLAVAVMPAHHLAAASVNLHQRRRRAPPMGRHQRCRPHGRRCKPSGSQSPAMGGRLAAVQKLGKDTGMTILCFF